MSRSNGNDEPPHAHVEPSAGKAQGTGQTPSSGTLHNPRYLTLSQLAEDYGFKPSRIRYLVHTRQIPHLKIGQSLRFDRIEVDRWLASKVVLTAAALEEEAAERQVRGRR